MKTQYIIYLFTLIDQTFNQVITIKLIYLTFRIQIGTLSAPVKKFGFLPFGATNRKIN